MKTFEEKFTAWVDGKLTGHELADFERELESADSALSSENARAERAGAQKLGDLLRTHLRAPALSNADFFNHQLMRQIEADQAAAEKSQTKEAPPRRAWSSFWTLPRMAWAGACCLALAGALYVAAVPQTAKRVAENQEYVAKILSAHTDDPNISATTIHSKENNATVLWLDGLDYIPENYKVK